MSSEGRAPPCNPYSCRDFPPARSQAQLAELGEAALAARVDAARAARDTAADALTAVEKGVEAATRELAGALGCGGLPCRRASNQSPRLQQ